MGDRFTVRQEPDGSLSVRLMRTIPHSPALEAWIRAAIQSGELAHLGGTTLDGDTVMPEGRAVPTGRAHQLGLRVVDGAGVRHA